MFTGIDTAAVLTAEQCASIRKAGYSFVGRYYISPSSKKTPLTGEEAKRITDAGLSILSVFETSADRARGGWTAGIYDGEWALKYAKAAGQPETSAIYFAVDYDAPARDYGTIEAYIRAAKSVIYPYRIGVYGGWNIVDYLSGKGICDCYWQCIAWSYGKKHSQRNVYQNRADMNFLGISVDLNQCEDLVKAGIWNYREAVDLAERRFNRLSEIPTWAQSTIEKFIRAGIITGSGSIHDEKGYPADMDLSYDMIRMMIFVDRYSKREVQD